MYEHEIIEECRSMNRLIKDQEIPDGALWLHNPYDMEKCLTRAERFHIGECQDLMSAFRKGMRVFYDHGEILRLPYRSCWLDGRSEARMKGMVSLKFGILMQEQNSPDFIQLTYWTKSADTVWSPGLFVFMIAMGKPLREIEGKEQYLPSGDDSIFDTNKNIAVCENIKRQALDLNTAEAIEHHLSIGRSIMEVAYFTILALNCKNVQAEVVPPSVALNEKRRKKGKPGLLSYHVLKVTVPRSGGTHGASGEGGSVRLHWQCGHFKKYGPPGLFGKYVGLFWWQPNLRGDPAQGIVMKDYEVKVDGRPTSKSG
jgi:hypothetical protein